MTNKMIEILIKVLNLFLVKVLIIMKKIQLFNF